MKLATGNWHKQNGVRMGFTQVKNWYWYWHELGSSLSGSLQYIAVEQLLYYPQFLKHRNKRGPKYKTTRIPRPSHIMTFEYFKFRIIDETIKSLDILYDFLDRGCAQRGRKKKPWTFIQASDWMKFPLWNIKFRSGINSFIMFQHVKYNFYLYFLQRHSQWND